MTDVFYGYRSTWPLECIYIYIFKPNEPSKLNNLQIIAKTDTIPGQTFAQSP